MENSNTIRHALNVINRVIELRNAGLKLKEHKNALREMLADNAADMPAVVCVAVSRAIKSASNETFFSRLIGARVDVEWLLKATEQMDAMHAEALEENKRFDWLANRFGIFWAGCDYVTRRTMIENAHAEALRIENPVKEKAPMKKTVKALAFVLAAYAAFAAPVTQAAQEYLPAGADGIQHLKYDTPKTHIDGKFCFQLDPKDQLPGVNCIPTGGKGGASGSN